MAIQKLYNTDTFSALINKFNGNADEISDIESLFGGGGKANSINPLSYVEYLAFAQNAFNGLADENILVETADKGSDAWETLEWSGRICDTNANPAVGLQCPKSKKFRFTFTVDQYRNCRIFGFLVTFSSQGGQISISKFEAKQQNTDDFIIRDAIGGEVSAWPGKFVVRCSQFVFGNSSTYYDKVRLTFECTEENTESYPSFIVQNIQALTHLVYQDLRKRIRMFENNADGIIVGGNVTADRFIGQADSVADITKYVVLNHSNWSSGIYTIDIQESGWLSEASTQEVFPSASITKEQLIAYQKAMIIGTNEFSGTTFTIKALGEVPTIDIPVQVLVRR